MYSKLYGKSIAAGVVLGLAGAASLLASATIDNPSMALFVKSAIFPIGLILIVFSDFALFTGGVATYANLETPKYTLCLTIMWIGNFIGAFLVAGLLPICAPDFINNTAETIIQAKCISPSIMDLVILGFLCNLLVCFGVTRAIKWQSPVSKIMVLFCSVFLFVICGFEHSIANMFYIPYAFNVLGTFDIGLLFRNLIPVTFGNILGGLTIVMFDNYVK